MGRIAAGNRKTFGRGRARVTQPSAQGRRGAVSRYLSFAMNPRTSTLLVLGAKHNVDPPFTATPTGVVHELTATPLLPTIPPHFATKEMPPAPSATTRAVSDVLPAEPEPATSKLVTINALFTGMENGPTVPLGFCWESTARRAERPGHGVLLGSPKTVRRSLAFVGPSVPAFDEGGRKNPAVSTAKTSLDFHGGEFA